MTRNLILVLMFISVVVSGCAARNAAHDQPQTAAHQFTYSWQFSDADAMKPRGGITMGAPVELDTTPNPGWLATQEPGVSEYERDRRAILSMAGIYRVSFNFIETVPLRSGYKPDRPYESWATEYIKVIEDTGNFISLQHILVMYFVDDKGNIQGPSVSKHWRQDWTYQDEEILEYKGNNTWQTDHVPKSEASGKWSQAVYQVDDTPRYEALGEWIYDGNYAAWTSPVTWRPLPRREFSVRSDYNVLAGVNRITITPTGWVHEQDNMKMVVDGNGKEIAKDPYLTRETGLDRYEMLTNFDDSAAKEYWGHTAPFWADVRETWDEVIETNPTLKLNNTYEGRKLYEYLFDYSDRLAEGGVYDSKEGKEYVNGIINSFVVETGKPSDKSVY